MFGSDGGNHAILRQTPRSAANSDRIVKPMIRAKINDPWREVSGRRRLCGSQRIQPNTAAIRSAASPSRCTNEETYVVQKLVRAGFGNNNVDTCARVCHSPTAMASKTIGESAGAVSIR